MPGTRTSRWSIVLLVAASSGLTWLAVGRHPSPAPPGRDATTVGESCEDTTSRLMAAQRRLHVLDEMLVQCFRRDSATAPPRAVESTSSAVPEESDPAFADLEELEAGQEDDPAWSRQTETRLESIAQQVGPLLGHTSVKCGRELCRVDVDAATPDTAPTPEARRSLERFVALASEILPESVGQDVPGQGRSTVIFARPGFPLAATEGGGLPRGDHLTGSADP